METRAHFVLIGLFTLLGILGGLGFFIWLASVQIDRQLTQYGVLFENVAGLDQSADVLFNGVGVGRVVGIRIWENDPSLVYVGIEIDADTPVAVDTMAQLESSGVTGVAYIALSGGAPGAALLTASADGPPIIPSRRSSFQSLVSSAPDILEDAALLMEQLQAITGPENQEYVQNILQNVDAATANLDAALQDFSEVSRTIEEATSQIRVFTDKLDEIGDTAQSTLEQADETLATITETFDLASEQLDALAPAIANAEAAFSAMDVLIKDDLSPLSDTLDQTLTSADQAFLRADGLMETDLGPALSDAREAMTAFNDSLATITPDIPGIVADLRAVVSEARAGIAAASPGLRDFGRLGGEARALVQNISDLVRRINRDPARFLLDDRVPDYRR